MQKNNKMLFSPTLLLVALTVAVSYYSTSIFLLFYTVFAPTYHYRDSKFYRGAS